MPISLLLTRRRCLSVLASVPLVCELSPGAALGKSLGNITSDNGENVPTGSGQESAGKHALQHTPGLRVAAGQFERLGRPVRALGVNYFDCFSQMLASSTEAYEKAFKRCENGFQELSALNIPFVRFNAGGFYPKDWRLYQSHPGTYFQRWDQLVQLAETYNIGLIPSLFWTFFTQSGLAKEPLSSWGDATSQTHRNMRSYTRQIVERCLDSEAIWAWEFGNEYNLDIDLPNQKMHLKHWYQSALGMPSAPGELDFLTSDHLSVALEAFANEVRQLDSSRPVLAGHASPRSSAWNLAKHGSWTTDSPRQWSDALKNQNPNSLSGLSLHLYPFHGDGSGLGGDPGLGTLQLAARVATDTKQPMWVGEFGPNPNATVPERIQQIEKMITWLEESDVRLAAAWVYDYAPQPTNNLASEENRPLLEFISQTNKKWQVSY